MMACVCVSVCVGQFGCLARGNRVVTHKGVVVISGGCYLVDGRSIY